MLTKREAFKVGFMSRCVEEGLSPEETLGRVKAARDKLAGLADIAKPVIGGAVNVGVPALLAAPPVLGGLTGFLAAKATDVDDTDVKEIRSRELIREYDRQAEQALRDKEVRDYRRQRDRTGRIFLSR